MKKIDWTITSRLIDLYQNCYIHVGIRDNLNKKGLLHHIKDTALYTYVDDGLTARFSKYCCRFAEILLPLSYVDKNDNIINAGDVKYTIFKDRDEAIKFYLNYDR